MKTMMSVDGKSIIRVSDEKASKLFEEGFRYVSKSMWKEKVRDVNKTEDTKKTKKSKKRKSK
tara:strand:- start:714 stop:899 length:186 start_codon:yes stop_codon:yes gene_type:complete